MVVEDEEDMRDLIRFALRKDPKLEVIGEASTAEEAVDIARETRPDVVILDHFLEGETRGLDIAPDLKEAAPDTKIVLFSSHDLSTEASREPACARTAQRTSCATIRSSRFCAPKTCAYLPTRSPKITFARVPPPPISPKSRFASRAWKTSLASVQNWITTSDPIASTKT